MADDAIKFVQLIENYECLYNNSLKEYARKDVTEKAWAAIAKETQLSVLDCKEKWKNLRNGFVRSLKPTPSGSSSKAKKPYYLHDIMQFVLPYVKPIQHSKNTGNILISDQMTQPDEEESRSTQDEYVLEKNTENVLLTDDTPSSVAPKRKKKCFQENNEVDQAVLQYIKEKKTKKTSELPADERKMFLLSLLPDVKCLSEKNLRHFKIKTLTLLEQLISQQEESMTNEYSSTPMAYGSSGSRCSSAFSTNTVYTPATSPIDMSTPVSVRCSSNDDYVITDLDYTI